MENGSRCSASGDSGGPAQEGEGRAARFLARHRDLAGQVQQLPGFREFMEAAGPPITIDGVDTYFPPHLGGDIQVGLEDLILHYAVREGLTTRDAVDREFAADGGVEPEIHSPGGPAPCDPG